MASTQELIEAMQEELSVLKTRFDEAGPKFVKYDVMELEYTPWKAKLDNSIDVMKDQLATLQSAPPAEGGSGKKC